MGNTVPSASHAASGSVDDDYAIIRMSAVDQSISCRSNFALFWPNTAVKVAHAGQLAHLAADQMVLVDCLLPIAFPDQLEWSARLIGLGGRQLDLRLGGAGRFLAIPLCGDESLASATRGVCAVLEDAVSQGPAHFVRDCGLLDALTALVVRLAYASIGGGLSRYRALTLDRAKQLVRASLADPDFSVSSLAALMKMSSRQLSSIFAADGTTTARYILSQRVHRASAMLSDRAYNHHQIAEIARACGFEDQAYFGRRFRQAFNITPREFRNKHANA